MSQNIVIIDYGAGNLFSVQKALARLGYRATLSNDCEVIQKADKVIFPGVGQAASAMQQLSKNGLDKLIPSIKVPLLGICLGMQLLCDFSEEGDTKGLGVFPMTAKRFSDNMKIPHMGWNTVDELKSPLFKDIPDNSFVYFVHSYYVPYNEYCIASCNYNGKFAAAIQKDNFYACQFHPEKSASIGEMILKNFLEIN